MINLDKNSDQSRRMQGKRSLAVLEACKLELKKELGELHKTFSQALEKTQEVMMNFPPMSRSRSLEASIMQSFFAEMLFENFGDKAFYGKYKRLILNIKGYLILFKKLNSKGMPMNIYTSNVQGIMSQNMTLDLFSSSNYNDARILYFGYQKNKIGEYINPQLLYIDEGNVVFSIALEDYENNINSINFNNVSLIEPKLKNKVQNRKIV
ncbi:hypothetical protein MUB18_15650 [Sphingobacterium sp. PCS056]|uniref:hypothetical protein n=1 Tax=Sphingobacterium sp. PCS056 TaxID=2931400 RepID=UPI00200FB386|nr:hypothetical protein [Sphingobacterium sp. PCS056]UPZ35537.1 hypothetical protein MUB18_15650 [Sphingobacterium sp. PCS056]